MKRKTGAVVVYLGHEDGRANRDSSRWLAEEPTRSSRRLDLVGLGSRFHLVGRFSPSRAALDGDPLPVPVRLLARGGMPASRGPTA